MASLEERLAAAEAAVPGLRPGCGKRVIRPEGAGPGRAPLAVVSVHGFSASPREIAPVPERLAAALGAPLYLARLTGHGQDGAALAGATLADWRRDIDEAAEIGADLGERVLWIGCSTGATLIADALARGTPGAGALFVSPNFGLAAKPVQTLLDLPGTRLWLPRVLTKERGFQPLNADHGRYWTTRYPPRALLPMAEAVRAARTAPLGSIAAPALVVWNPADRVVSGRATEAAMARWGGPVAWRRVDPGPGDDPMGHVVAGDILSPGQTAGVIDDALAWARRSL